MSGPDPGALARWLGDRVEVAGPLRVHRIGDGQSNVTSLVTDAAGRAWVLRHRPAGAAADDALREARVLRGLAGGPVPVPAVVASGSGVEGVPGAFVVMERSPGTVLARQTDADALPAPRRRALAGDVVAVLARLHGVAPGRIGPVRGDADDLFARRVRRAARNWEAWAGSVPGSVDAAWREAHRRIAAAPPRAQRLVVVHGDYRLANLLVDGGRVTAVLDWELCTHGDPLVDLAWLLDDWRGPGEPAVAIPSPTRAGGFGDRAELAADYAARTGLDLSGLDRYRALTHWTAATLLQGVLVRRRSGALGGHGVLDPAAVERSVRDLVEGSLSLLPGTGSGTRSAPRPGAARSPGPSSRRAR